MTRPETWGHGTQRRNASLLEEKGEDTLPSSADQTFLQSQHRVNPGWHWVERNVWSVQCLIFSLGCRVLYWMLGFYVNTEQIGPMPRLRVNPTILWLPNIVISLVSIIYISSIHLFVHFLGGIRMNWVGNVMLSRYVLRFSVKYLLVVKCLLSGLMLRVARGSQKTIYGFREKMILKNVVFFWF